MTEIAGQHTLRWYSIGQAVERCKGIQTFQLAAVVVFERFDYISKYLQRRYVLASGHACEHRWIHCLVVQGVGVEMPREKGQPRIQRIHILSGSGRRPEPFRYSSIPRPDSAVDVFL